MRSCVYKIVYSQQQRFVVKGIKRLKTALVCRDGFPVTLQSLENPVFVQPTHGRCIAGKQVVPVHIASPDASLAEQDTHGTTTS